MKAAQQKQCDQICREDALWTLSARPCSEEEDQEALISSMACSTLQYGSQQLQLAITASTVWAPADLAHLETIIQSRNRFVCMQLVTMVKEQYNKVRAAEASGDISFLHSAKFMFLGTVTLAVSNEMVAAGLFYPRSCSKRQLELPHMYVELICCNSPGKGYGTVLLQHIEQFTAGCCEHLSAGCFGSMHPAEDDCGVSAGLGSSEGALVAQGQLGHMGSGSCVLPLVSMDAAVPVGGVNTACCAACSVEDCLVVPGAGLGPVFTSAQQIMSEVSAVPQEEVSVEKLSLSIDIPSQGVGLTVVCDSFASSGTTFSSASSCSKKSSGSSEKRIHGIKLLSVASAQPFYEKNGYGAPDVCKEMFKPLLWCHKRVGLGDGSNILGSSCNSITTSMC